MAVTDEPVPPIPSTYDIILKDGTSNKITIPWLQWLTQVRTKINILNESIFNLSDVTGTGVLVKNGAAWLLRTITGTANRVTVTNGDGVSGNPTVDVVTADLVPGTNVTFTGSGVDRIVDNGLGNLTINASGGGGGSGTLLQTVVTTSTAAVSITSTTIPADNTIPQNTEGAAYTNLDVTITPLSTTSFLVIAINFPMISSSANIGIRLAVFRDAGANAIFATTISPDSVNNTAPANFFIRVSSTAMVATTFTMRVAVSSGTGYINRTSGTAALFGGVLIASMVVKEVT